MERFKFPIDRCAKFGDTRKLWFYFDWRIAISACEHWWVQAILCIDLMEFLYKKTQKHLLAKQKSILILILLVALIFLFDSDKTKNNHILVQSMEVVTRF